MNFAGLGWMVLLLLANGFFVASEFAFIAARRNVLEQRNTKPAKAAVKLSRELSLSLAAAQLGITIASLLLGYVAEPAVASILEVAISSVVDIPDDVLHTISLVIALSFVVFLHMVIGEMAPKNIAIAAPERSALAMAIPFRAFLVVFRPFIWSLNGVANAILRLFGVKPADALDAAHSAEDLAVVIAAGRRDGVIEDFAHRLLTGAILLGDRDAYDVMIPRLDIDSLPVSASYAEIEDLVQRTGHSRIPIHTGEIDEVIGFVHVKDLLAVDETRRVEPMDRSLIRPIMVVPESAHAQDVLTEMRRTRSHLALVIDEHGGTAGLISLEDIAEELVGEIRDEHDPNVVVHLRTADGRLLLGGGTRTDQLGRHGIQVPEGDYETVGGFVMEQLGRIPSVGDEVDAGAARIRVTRMDGRRVTEVEVAGASGPVAPSKGPILD
jgi:CBS domain containing-hemolysin-like protein